MTNTNFYEACLAAQQEWFDSMELSQEEHQFSKSFERKMNKLLDKMRNDKYHHLTRRATRTIIIAAILLAIATTVVAAPRTREYIVEKFNDHSTYTVEEGYEGEIDDLVVGYVPEGFELTYSNVDKENSVISYEYRNDDLYFGINKTSAAGIKTFDTEFNNSETISIDNIDYIYYYDENGYNGIIWNNSDSCYFLSGTIDKSTLIKIAENLK